MKFVYCVFEKEDWQANHLLSVFDTEEDADEYVATRKYPSKYVVQEWEVM